MIQNIFSARIRKNLVWLKEQEIKVSYTELCTRPFYISKLETETRNILNKADLKGRIMREMEKISKNLAIYPVIQ